MDLGYIDLSAEKEKLVLGLERELSALSLLKCVEGAISKNDDMYAGNAAHYFMVGLSAIQCINDSLSNVKNLKINSILDMPCGGGRVLRFLRQQFPNAKLTAVDINKPLVDYCADVFGAKGIYSKKELGSLELESRFDLIWCGSLLTHLDANTSVDLLNFFNRHLEVGGVLIFSAHGKFVWENITNGHNKYLPNDASTSRMVRDYQNSGYGYANYPGVTGYGVSVTSAEWLRRQFNKIQGWNEIYFKEKAWDNHHDIYCIQKSR